MMRILGLGKCIAVVGLMLFAAAASAQTPVVGVAETATTDGRQITLELVLENLGTDNLNTVGLTKDLDAIFGALNYAIISTPQIISGSLVINSGFDGTSDTNLLDGSSTLAIGATASVGLIVEVVDLIDVGSGGGIYASQASASAIGELSSSTTTDLSDNGTDPDPNGNGDPTEAGENDPTPLNLTGAVIGVAKQASFTGRSISFVFYLENLASEDLANISLIDNLDGVLGAGNYFISSPPFTNSSNITVNASYDGSGNDNLISAGSLAYQGSAEIELGVDLLSFSDQGNGPGVYLNQATGMASGSASGTLTSDLSDNGSDPDPNGDGDPTGAGEDDPTLIDILDNPEIGVAKMASVSGNLITFDFFLEVFGNRDLSNISLVDDLDVTFGAGNYSLSSAPTLVDNPGTLSLNAAYNGSSQNDLISSGSLILGETMSAKPGWITQSGGHRS